MSDATKFVNPEEWEVFEEHDEMVLRALPISPGPYYTFFKGKLESLYGDINSVKEWQHAWPIDTMLTGPAKLAALRKMGLLAEETAAPASYTAMDYGEVNVPEVPQIGSNSYFDQFGGAIDPEERVHKLVYDAVLAECDTLRKANSDHELTIAGLRKERDDVAAKVATVKTSIKNNITSEEFTQSDFIYASVVIKAFHRSLEIVRKEFPDAKTQA